MTRQEAQILRETAHEAIIQLMENNEVGALLLIKQHAIAACERFAEKTINYPNADSDHLPHGGLPETTGGNRIVEGYIGKANSEIKP